MKYFKNISNLDVAKKQYRKLAMQMHPDKGGNETSFINMQNEYQAVLLELQQKADNSQSNKSAQNEILHELSQLGKVLLKSRIPQEFLSKKAQKANNPYERILFKGIIKILDEL